MPYYEYECEHGLKEDRFFDMGQAPSLVKFEHKGVWLGHVITVSLCVGKRVFSPPQFTEDRCRFARNPRNGKDFSDMLGTAYPKDRKERDAMYALKGIEPVTSKAEMPKHWQAAADYAEHVRTGGERLSPQAEKAMVAEPPPKVKSVSQMLKESNVRFG